MSDKKINQAVTEVESGLVDANLGGSLFKKRVGINNQGKSGSLRTLIGIKSGYRAFFLYGFAKNEKDNISKQEKEAFKEMAKVLFDLSEDNLNKALKAGAFREIIRVIQEG